MHSLSCRIVLVVALALAGCSAVEGPPAESPDSGSTDSGFTDSGPNDAGPTPPLCPTPIAGTGAFSRTLLARVAYVDQLGESHGTLTEELELYLPDGLVAGGRALLTAIHHYPVGVVVAEATLGADRSAQFPRFNWIDGGQERSVTQAVLTSDGTVTATIERNFADSDFGVGATSPAVFCSTGAGRGPGHLTYRSREPSPLLPSLLWTADVPLDASTLPPSPVLISGQPMSGTVGRGLRGVSLSPPLPIPPTQPITFAAADLKDVLGRPVTVDAMPDPLRPSESVTDLSLVTAPPEGASAVSGADVSFRSGDWSVGSYGADSYDWLVSLGTPPAQSATVDLFVRLECFVEQESTISAAVVTADGTSSAVTVSCDEQMRPVNVVIPGAGPLWLAVHRSGEPPRPQWLSGPRGPTFHVGALQFRQ